jgi:hypothetical protein
MNRAHPLIVAACIAAQSSSCSQEPHWKLQLSSSASSASGDESFRVEMNAGSTTVIEMLVLGASPDAVAFRATNLPAFATLRGTELTVAPGRQDAGEYAITLIATVASESQSAPLNLLVHRTNTPPKWGGGFMFGDDTGFRRDCLSPSTCTARGTPKLYMFVCDPENDRVVIDVEVVPRGQPFTGVPTHSTSLPTEYPSGASRDCATAYGPVSLTGLAVEHSYDYAIRVSDEFGAVANVPLASNGWLRRDFFGFDQGPCTTRQCACVAAGGTGCAGDPYQCCSGICDTSVFGYGICH